MKKQIISLEQSRFEFSKAGGEVFLSKIEELNWHDAAFLVCSIDTQNEWLVPLIIKFYNAQGECLQVHIGTIPQMEVIVAFPLSALDAQNVFLSRTPGKLKTLISGTKINKSEITRISIGTCSSHQSQSFMIKEMYLDSEEPNYLLPEQILVDAYGQNKTKDWQGKTKGEEELLTYLQSQLNQKNEFPTDWSKYGGWRNKQFEGTGFFRTEHDGKRWWLVDPEGYAFWSTGLDCVRPEVQALLDGIEKFYEWLPDKTKEFQDMYYMDEKGSHYGDFSLANLIRAFGEDYIESWIEMTRDRMKQWRFNTIGNWSSLDFIKKANIPYVLPLSGFPSTKKTIFRDFPDAFSQEYIAGAKKFAKQLEEFREDPYMIGYFLTNEPLWAFAGDVNLAEELMEKEEILESKYIFMNKMKEKYKDDIQQFNKSWNMNLHQFEDLLIPMKKPSTFSKQAKLDLENFTKELVYQYTKVVCDAVKEIDQHHLNLGMRYAWISTDNIFEGSKLFDVFTLNNYSMAPNQADIMNVSKKSGLPVLIGEFHFGAIDVGLPSTGLKGVTTQAERAKAYRYYIENAAAMPDLIGTHYFTLNDQAVLGRFDGENFQIGVVDICHRPYKDFVEGITEAHERIYDVAAGIEKPYSDHAEEIPRIGF
ncbi:beta-galactosidase [Bacillus sp. FSL K6-3431]|uniref:beta-galactosidase n=1 Tax=Bacillus sp. FSL K6-3431 TaxID=2921500 RepID=UPI0030FC6FF5